MEKLLAVLQELECPVCMEYMVNEISLCKGGHSVCAKCKDSLLENGCPICKLSFAVERNYSFEKVAAAYTYPCRNKGCDQQLDAENINKHEKNCEFGVYSCPLYFIGCAWVGEVCKHKEHIEESHKEYIEVWKSNLPKSLYIYTIFHSEELFIVFHKIAEGVQTYSAMYAGLKKNVEDFSLNLDFDDQTGKGYEFIVAAPCISRCKVEEVFDKEKIVLCATHSMLPMCFVNDMNSYVIKTSIKDKVNCKTHFGS